MRVSLCVYTEPDFWYVCRYGFNGCLTQASCPAQTSSGPLVRSFCSTSISRNNRCQEFINLGKKKKRKIMLICVICVFIPHQCSRYTVCVQLYEEGHDGRNTVTLQILSLEVLPLCTVVMATLPQTLSFRVRTETEFLPLRFQESDT